ENSLTPLVSPSLTLADREHKDGARCPRVCRADRRARVLCRLSPGSWFGNVPSQTKDNAPCRTTSLVLNGQNTPRLAVGQCPNQARGQPREAEHDALDGMEGKR